jgi:hypothetical protein
MALQRNGNVIFVKSAGYTQSVSGWAGNVLASLYPSRRWLTRLSVAITVVMIVLLLTNVLTSIANTISLGGLVSEKLVDRNGTANSSLLIGSTVSGEQTVVGFAPAVATTAVTDPGEGTVTLNGTVTTMNGMPSAVGYFQWGYAKGSLPSTTAPFAITATGDYSTVLTGFTQSNTVYYRFYADADGTNYGSVMDTLTPAGAGGNLLKLIIPLVVALIICVTMLYFVGGANPVGMLASGVVGVLAFYMVKALLEVIS